MPGDVKMEFGIDALKSTDQAKAISDAKEELERRKRQVEEERQPKAKVLEEIIAASMPGDVKVESVWQPIETAPKGTPGSYEHGPWLLLMMVHADCNVPHYTVGRFNWHGSGRRGAWADWNRNLKPTHWMHLPPPDATCIAASKAEVKP